MPRTCANPTLQPALIACLVLLAGCTEPTGQPPHRQNTVALRTAGISAFPQLPDSIKEVRFQLTPDMQTADPNDVALINAVRSEGGIVTIGFKPPNSPLSRETGVIPAMSRAAALDYRSQVVALGAELVHTMRTSNTIVVRIAPELAPVLRRLPFVNYLNPVARAHTRGHLINTARG